MSLEAIAVDAVFKALADPTRRQLLDRLREQNGQTQRELCERLDMARQSATQHLDILVRANLVTVVRRGRERLHYLNPTPIHEIQERWISEFELPHLKLISAVKHRAEEYTMAETTRFADTTEATTGAAADAASASSAANATVPTYVYVTYIHATAEQVWRALTDADLTARFWGHTADSDWQPGSPWALRRADGSGVVDVVGTVIETEPPARLVVTFDDSPKDRLREDPSVVTYLIEPHEDIVRLTVTHENLPNPEMFGGIARGWPAVLANLKSLLETGDVLPQAPWSM